MSIQFVNYYPTVASTSVSVVVTRTDNASVVSSGSMKANPDSTWSYQFIDSGYPPAPGIAYTYVITDATNAITQSGSIAAWFYSDQGSLTSFLGARDLAIESDVNADNYINPQLILADGLKSDSWFNAMLRGGYFASPVTVSAAPLNTFADTVEARQFWRSLSDMDVAIRLNDHRAIQNVSGQPAGEEVDKWFVGIRKYVNDTIAAVKVGSIQPLMDLAVGSPPLPSSNLSGIFVGSGMTVVEDVREFASPFSPGPFINPWFVR